MLSWPDMHERDVVKKIKDHIIKVYGGTAHKFHANAFTERGVADLFGSLPGGRAYFIEVKVPGGKPTQWQIAWLAEERKRNSIAAVCTSTDEVDKLFKEHGIYPQPK